MWKFYGLILTFALPFGFGGIASAEARCPDPMPDQPSPEQLIACLVEMRADLQKLREADSKPVPSLPSGAIVMADRECASLGPEWAVYTNAGGRFPIAAGATQDVNGQKRQFVVGHPDNVGEYEHVLLKGEMPTHNHDFTGAPFTIYGWATPATGTIGVGNGSHPQGKFTPSGSVGDNGGNGAHNNIPPYIALNFCQKG